MKKLRGSFAAKTTAVMLLSMLAVLCVLAVLGTCYLYDSNAYTRDYAFVGLVKSYDPKTGIAVVEQRNKMVLGDEIEVFGRYGMGFKQTIEEMTDEEGNPIESAPHPQQIVKIRMKEPVSEDWMFRKKQVK